MATMNKVMFSPRRHISYRYWLKFSSGVVHLAAFVLLLLTVPVQAQEVTEQRASIGVEEITVTARRREESMQDAPISIAAMTGEMLLERNIDTVTDIGRFTPNVTFKSSTPVSASNATAAFFIRGIGQNEYALSRDPGVGLYLDGVFISRGVGNVLDVLDIERVEVLRGPQGTLFGRNTIGGAVNVITRKPADEFGGRIEATTGRFNRAQIKASLDIPVAEGLYTSVAGYYHNRDGYVKGVVPGAPDLGDDNTLAGRFAVRAEPSDDISINISIDGTRSREESAPNTMVAVNENATAAGIWNAVFSGAPGICADQSNPARLSDARCFNSQWELAPYQHAGTWQSNTQAFEDFLNRPYESASDMDIWGVSGIFEWRLTDDIAFKSITSYRKVDGFWTRDADHSPTGIVHTKNNWTQDQLSQEIQFQGNSFGGRLDWVVGGYYADESGNHQDAVELVDALFLSGALLKVRSLAAFGQATYAITDSLSLTAGIRWTEDKKTFGNDNQFIVLAGFLTGAPFNPDGSGLQDGDPLMGALGQRASNADTAWTPMTSLSYRWSEQFMTYVSYSEGFKGGGYDQRAFPPVEGIRVPFAPETSESYEIGFKSDLFDRRVRVNGAVFNNDYGNLQVTVNDPSLGFTPITANAAKARIRGFELELQMQPTAEFRFDAGIGYIDAKYRQVAATAVAAGITVDKHLMNAPKWTLSAGVSYDIVAPGLGMFTPRVDWSYRSAVYNDAVNTPALINDGSHLVNASINYLSESEKWGITLGVMNLTKDKSIDSGYADSFAGLIEAVYGRPREWFLRGYVNF